MPHQHHGEPGAHPSRGEGFDLRGYFTANLLRDPASVEKGCWHPFLILSQRRRQLSAIENGAIVSSDTPLAYNAVVMIAKDLLEMLVCPADRQPLEYRQNPESLKCTKCHRVYPVKDDIPIMLIDEAVVEP